METLEINHTPTPWKYEKSTNTIRSESKNYWLATVDSFDGAVNNQANAEFIVRACNSHKNLLVLLKLVEKRICSDKKEKTKYADGTGMLWGIHEDIQKAIAKAEEK